MSGMSPDNSPKSTSPSTSTSPESSTKASSPNGDQTSKTGRPSNWTASRQRKLARLYLYSLLQPKEICEILKEKNDDKVTWEPRANSAAKTVNALLDNQPRWLRPKDREDMDRKILALSDCKKQRTLRRNLAGMGLAELDNNGIPVSDVVPAVEFSETPLENLLASAPRELLTSAFNPPIRARGPVQQPFADPVFELRVQESVSNQGEWLPTYGYHNIARGARGRTFCGYYECLICNQINAHSNSYLDQMKCASEHGRDRFSPDESGLTPAHALITMSRSNDDMTPETPAQTAELFRILFPEGDPALRRALYVLDPAGHNLIYNIARRGYVEILEYIRRELEVALGTPVMANRLLAMDEKTLSTYMSTSSLKLRLPHHSTSYLKSIARLLKTHSVSYAATFSTPNPDPALVGPSCEVTLTLPDAVLILDRHVRDQGVCIAGLPAHDSKTCWCHVGDNLGSKTWVCEAGLVNKLVSDPPSNILRLDLQFRDIFGNNVLHMLAARGAQISVIIEALEHGADGNAKNTAGQTFLHVLAGNVLRTLAESPGFLARFLKKLVDFNIKCYDFDVFGRSFFHMLTHKLNDSLQLSSQILEIPGLCVPPSRDAFDCDITLESADISNQDTNAPTIWITDHSIPVVSSVSDEPAPSVPVSIIQQAPFNDNSASSSLPGSMYRDFGSPPNLDADLLSPDDEIFVFKQARLLETARAAFKTPKVEDEEGRNGLQCLAEASLTLSIGNKKAPAGSSNKRKADQAGPNPSSTRLTLRFELVQKMIALGVHVNNYDRYGNTVLMAFVSHLKDGEDDRTHANLLHYIIQNGANIDWRNRQGETALHIAVRLGRKVATKVLLEKRANVHARTAEAMGVLALGERHYLRARDDPQTYASIHACMALAIRYGAVPAPTLVQEWRE